MSTRPRVVVVGAGFGGLWAARALARAPVDVTVLDRHNYHLFQPLLYQVATAGLEPESIARPVRTILRKQRNVDFRLTEVTGVDLARRELATDGGPIGYDYLILAMGGETNYFGLDGLRRHAFGLKDIDEAELIKNHVLACFEHAMMEPDADRRRALLTFVVVGGGPTGVEMAGALSELIRLVLVKDYPRLNVKDVRVLLLEATDRLLAAMPAPLAEAAARKLWDKQVPRSSVCARRRRAACAWSPRCRWRGTPRFMSSAMRRTSRMMGSRCRWSHRWRCRWRRSPPRTSGAASRGSSPCRSAFAIPARSPRSAATPPSPTSTASRSAAFRRGWCGWWST